MFFVGDNADEPFLEKTQKKKRKKRRMNRMDSSIHAAILIV